MLRYPSKSGDTANSLQSVGRVKSILGDDHDQSKDHSCIDLSRGRNLLCSHPISSPDASRIFGGRSRTAVSPGALFQQVVSPSDAAIGAGEFPQLSRSDFWQISCLLISAETLEYLVGWYVAVNPPGCGISGGQAYLAWKHPAEWLALPLFFAGLACFSWNEILYVGRFLRACKRLHSHIEISPSWQEQYFWSLSAKSKKAGAA